MKEGSFPKMKRFLLTTVAFGVLAVPAMAADMAPAPYYKAPVPVVLPAWTGFYVGVNGGYGGNAVPELCFSTGRGYRRPGRHGQSEA
jgi:opacity protein-like surface antigen